MTYIQHDKKRSHLFYCPVELVEVKSAVMPEIASANPRDQMSHIWICVSSIPLKVPDIPVYWYWIIEMNRQVCKSIEKGHKLRTAGLDLQKIFLLAVAIMLIAFSIEFI